MKPNLKVVIISDAVLFFQLREEWNSLLQNSASNTIFLRWEWLYNWWSSYSDKNHLFLITVRDANDSLIGIAPLYRRKAHGLLFNEIKFLGANIVCSDYLDFILLEEREKEALHAITDHLKQNHREWDVLALTDIPSDSCNLKYLIDLFDNYETVINQNYTICPFIDLSLKWDNVYNSFSTRLKNSIRRKDKKFQQLFNSNFVKIGCQENLTESFDEFIKINKLRFDEKRIKSPFSDGKFSNFHQNVLNEFFPKGMAKLCFLKVGGKYIAGLYLLIYDKRYYYYQSGFDPDWEKLSPGTLVLYYCMRDAIENYIEEFDFLQGNEKYKNNWTNRQKKNVGITVYDNSFRGCFAKMFSRAIILLKRATKTYKRCCNKSAKLLKLQAFWRKSF